MLFSLCGGIPIHKKATPTGGERTGNRRSTTGRFDDLRTPTSSGDSSNNDARNKRVGWDALKRQVQTNRNGNA